MLKKFWVFKKKKPAQLSDEGGLFKELFDFLTRQISFPKKAEQLIGLGYKLQDRSVDETFRTYLLFEKYICSFEPGKKYTPATLRAAVKERFPVLHELEPFSILFLCDTEKKNTIAIQFLHSFLQSLADQFGNAG